MNAQQALGYLIAGHINHAFATFEDPDIEGGGCCTECCGPCGALAWYRDNAPDDADIAVISLMTTPTWRYDWQDPVTARIDWTMIGETWADDCPFTDEHEPADVATIRRGGTPWPVEPAMRDAFRQINDFADGETHR